MKKIVEKLRDVFYPRIIFCIGLFLRIIYGIKQNPMHFQHDVVNTNGHFDYALYIYEHLSLPLTNNNQFYQGPLNAIIQALWMKIVGVFIDSSDFDVLYSSCKILSIIYSIVTLYIIYKIAELFELKKYVKTIILFICAIYPAMVIMAGQYNNDSLAYMFFFLSLYFAIKWCKNISKNNFKIKEIGKSVLNIIFLAISIGLGMLSKISVGLIAFIIGPMFIIIWINALRGLLNKDIDDIERNKRKKFFTETTIQFLIFILIVFPIGLSYGTRNFILFNQSYSYVPQVAKNTMLDVDSVDIVKRFLSFPIERMKVKKYDIFHAKDEYSIWIDLLKTSTYEEFNYGSGVHYIFAVVMLICNVIFYIISIISIVYFIIKLIKMIIERQNNVISLQMNLSLISFMLVVMALISYVIFNINYPYSCTSNYRYIMYLTFANVSIIAFMLDGIDKKMLKFLFNMLCIVFCISVSLFMILV